MRAKTGSDGFATFLQSLRLEREQEAPPDVSRELLGSLRKSGAQSVTRLLADTALPLTDFLEALSAMSDTGVVTVGGNNGERRVELTETGKRVAELAAA